MITEYPLDANSHPQGIAGGPDGNVWFTDDYRIGRISPEGVITEFPAGAATVGISAGPDGNLWFTESGGNKIGRITPEGAITEYFIATANSAPWGITAGPDGNLWFTERAANQIGRLAPSAMPIPTPTVAPTSTPTATATITPTPTVTPTPTPTATATRTSTPTPSPRVVAIQVGSAIGAPGDVVDIIVSLHTSGASVAATANDIIISNQLVITLFVEECKVNPSIGKELIASVVQAGRLRFFVQSSTNSRAIPDGELYRCPVLLSRSSLPGTYALTNSGPLAFSPGGTEVHPVIGTDGVITVSLLPHACPGDCNANSLVTVDELVTGVNIALGTAPVNSCPAFDTNGNGAVTVDELVQAVNAALVGCNP